MEDTPRKRACAIILRDDKILLIHRIKPSEEYYTLPGGGVEAGETLEEGMVREIKEELSVDGVVDRLLFEIKSLEREDYYFLIKEFAGEPELGGPEASRMTPDNQYRFTWKTLQEFECLEKFYPNPKEAKGKIVEFWKSHGT